MLTMKGNCISGLPEDYYCGNKLWKECASITEKNSYQRWFQLVVSVQTIGIIVLVILFAGIIWFLMYLLFSLFCGIAIKTWARERGMSLLKKKCYYPLFAPRNPLPFHFMSPVCRVSFEDSTNREKSAWVRLSYTPFLFIDLHVKEVVWDD